MSDADRAAALLDESQLRFIQDEFGYDPDALGALSDDDFEKLSDRGKMAESIVTAIGNELYGVED